MKKDNYKIFYFMLFVSFIIMYSVMFLNVAKIDHIYFSMTRFYMALLMVSPMSILMLLLMPKMFTDKKKNKMIIFFAILVFSFALIFLRTQTFIGDNQYMKAMIPHHSSAILTSQEANIQDPEVKELSIEIIETQEREINLMKEFLKKLQS